MSQTMMKAPSMRLLIIEDDEGLGELERGIAGPLGMDVTVAATGGAALVAMRSCGFDLLLVDYTLPDMKAPELIATAEGEGIALPPFIVTTGAGDERIAVAMMRRGARDYLVKDSTFLDRLPDALSRTRRELETERRLGEASEALTRSERLYRLIAENVTDVIFLYDLENHRFTYVSPSINRIIGISDDRAIQMAMADFLDEATYRSAHDDMAVRAAAFRDGDDSRKTALYRATIRRPRGGPLRVEVMMTLLWTDDRRIELLGVARDVEERTLMEEEITRSLREKEVLLKEVHHRVKNNLQIVSSLMNLQLQGLRSKKAADALIDSQNRIRAMAMIHEQLYRSVDLSEICFGDYVTSLVPVLLQAAERNIEVEYRMEPWCLSLDSAIPCGLILNELVTNALKHAVTKVRNPRLLVEFGKDETSNSYRFAVEDNGPGLPEGFALESASTLGFTLINALVGQLGGRLEAGGGEGARFAIVFPADPSQG